MSNMTFNVRWVEPYANVVIDVGNTRVDLGLFNVNERKELAQSLREAIIDLREPLKSEDFHQQLVLIY